MKKSKFKIICRKTDYSIKESEYLNIIFEYLSNTIIDYDNYIIVEIEDYEIVDACSAQFLIENF